MSKIRTKVTFKENPRAKAQIRKGVETGLTAVGIAVENESIGNLNQKVYNGDPRSYELTGKLKQSIFYKVMMKTYFGRVIIGATMDYAPFVEYPGITRKYPGKPYMRPAFDKVRYVAKAIIAKYIKRAL